MKTIDKFVIENAVSVQGSDGAYYHHLEVCKLLKLQQERSYSEEEFKEMVYHMVGGLAQANNITFNGAILDELFNKFKSK